LKHLQPLLALIVAAVPCQAEVIEQNRAWLAATDQPALLAFQPFDPQLGVLERVEVSLSGTMFVQAFASPQPDGRGGFVPYSFAMLTELVAITPGGDGFEFGSNAQWLESFQVTGNGEDVAAARAFGLSFEFDELSDLIGFTLPDVVAGFTQPPTTIIGRRGNYLEDLVNELLGIQQLFLVPGLPAVIGAPVPVVVTGAEFDGLARLAYVYQPHQDVPEPAGLLLMALGLGGLRLASRSRPALMVTRPGRRI
jgi:hypothetical protein